MLTSPTTTAGTQHSWTRPDPTRAVALGGRAGRVWRWESRPPSRRATSGRRCGLTASLAGPPLFLIARPHSETHSCRCFFLGRTPARDSGAFAQTPSGRPRRPRPSASACGPRCGWGRASVFCFRLNRPSCRLTCVACAPCCSRQPPLWKTAKTGCPWEMLGKFLRKNGAHPKKQGTAGAGTVISRFHRNPFLGFFNYY